MNIVVCVKQVPDTASLKLDAQGMLAADGQDWVMNPFCEYAVETAIRLKESGEGHTVTVFCIGNSSAKETLKRAIAMGADAGFVLSDAAFDGADPYQRAAILKKAIDVHAPDAQLVLAGQQATDDMAGTTGPMLAALLNWPSLMFISSAQVSGEAQISVTREVEAGRQTATLQLPAVLCTMKCDYEPRIPSIKGVMKANRAEIPVLDAGLLGVSVPNALTVQQALLPKAQKQAGQKLTPASTQEAAEAVVTFLKSRQLV